MRAGVIVQAVLGVAFVVGLVVLLSSVANNPDFNLPDSGAQLKTAEACLKTAGLGVDDDIPPYAAGQVTPDYQLDVWGKGGKDHDHLAYIFLFNDKSSAEAYLEDEKNYAEDDPLPKGIVLEQRGPEVVRLFGDAPQARAIRQCADKAGAPPPSKKT